MTTRIMQHPDATTLMSFAAGSLAEPLAAVVAAHASVCPTCRAELADLDLLGAALLASPSLVAAGGTGETQLRMPTAADLETSQPRRVDAGERLPAPIALAYGLSFATIPWKRLGPGVWHHRLSLSEAADGDLRLLKIAPGRAMPDHGHGGTELTLVLDGAFSDATGNYTWGDVQDVGDDIEHKPLADASTGCVCLIASERPARFKGLMGRLLQPLTGM